MQEMLNPLATYSTAHTSRQKTWKERKQSTKNKVSRANKLHIKMFIVSGYQEDERSDPVVKCTNPRLSVGGCTSWSSTRHKALESSKIMEHFEPRNHLDGWWVSVSQTWTSYIEAQHRIQLLESYFHFQYF